MTEHLNPEEIAAHVREEWEIAGLDARAALRKLCIVERTIEDPRWGGEEWTCTPPDGLHVGLPGILGIPSSATEEQRARARVWAVGLSAVRGWAGETEASNELALRIGALVLEEASAAAE